MVKRLLTLNVLLGLVAAGFGAYIVWELMRPVASPPPERPRAISSASPSALATPAVRQGAPGTWTVIASRNLFSPTRSETAGPAGQTAAQVSQLPRPLLFGVVIRTDGALIAYLEDPVTKRVAGYRVGDTVAGGVVQRITSSGVVLARPDGTVDVRLHDPAKPRAPVPSQPQAPGAPPPGTQGQPPVEGQPAPPAPSQAPGTSQLGPPYRRPLPPNLIRRLPQGPPSDAPSR
jgi:hypothetical protein